MTERTDAVPGDGFWDSLDRTLLRLRELLHLRADTDEEGTVSTVRRNIDFRSANAWALACAMLIACVGLDTNNMMAVFGAMLISPLMGPVVGAGMGLGIDDPELSRRALRNLGFAILIAITVSTFYFLISPIAIARSEILSFTRPTFFDVMVAIFGGATGVVAQSRRTKGSSIAGVAMATVMLPPLCTVGFGLATGQPHLALSAFYLFLINSLFICLSTFAFVRYLGFTRVRELSPESRRRTQRRLTVVAVLVMFPSVILAWRLQQESLLTLRAREFVARDLDLTHRVLVQQEFDLGWPESRLKLTFVGEAVSDAEVELMKTKMRARGLPPEALQIQSVGSEIELRERIEDRVRARFNELHQRSGELARLESQVRDWDLSYEISAKISRELQPLFPDLQHVTVLPQNAGARIFWKRAPGKSDLKRLTSYIQARAQMPPEKFEHSTTLNLN